MNDSGNGVRWRPGPLERLGPRPWLVLGGGGMKGLAHVGAWQALEEAGVRPHGIVGTSIGSLVGACLAAGLGWHELAPLAFDLRQADIARVNRRAILLNGIRQEAVLLAEPLQEYIRRVLPVGNWDELILPFQVNAVDLGTGETRWFGSGADTSLDLADALYASSALPLLYPPLVADGHAWVDGGVEISLAPGRAAELGATGIVAIDVGSGKRGNPDRVREEGLIAMHQRIFSIMSWRKRTDMVDHWTDPPLLYVRPRLDGLGTFEFNRTAYFLEEGYRATRAALMGGMPDPPASGPPGR